MTKLLQGTVRFLVTAMVMVALWMGSIALFKIPAFIVPSPASVGQSLWGLPQYYLRHTSVTFFESAMGAILGLALGLAAGIALRYSRLFGRWIEPVLHATQIFPKEALAPLFAVALGYGMFPKIVISTLICFFPLSLATARGLRTAPTEALLHMKVLGASKREVFWYCELPYAVPFIAASLRVCTSLSVIGAVVGEFVGATAGLGYVIRGATADLAMDRMYAALLLLGLIGGLLYLAVAVVERTILSPFLSVRED